ncbi:MAG TPA: NINE protein [Ktedonobacterales bacterium]|nr:NINE protein [Ktedonobacterales bacterium]
MNTVEREQWALALLTATFDCAQQKFFQAEYGRRRRSPAKALALCLTLGAFGAHEFYMGRLVSATLRLLFFWTLLPLLLALIDAMFLTRRVHAYNTRMAHALAEIVEESFAAARADAEAQVGMAYLKTPPRTARRSQESPSWLAGTPDWLVLRENDGSR